MFSLKFITGLIVTSLLILCGCAASNFSTFEQKVLSTADSLFLSGNYEYAKVKYAKVIELKPKSDAAKTAQYYLGYINVYYDNPFSNWEAALREFKVFASLYPNDTRIGEVYSWIRLLVVMQSNKKEYIGASTKLELLSKKELEAAATQTAVQPPAPPKKNNFDALSESLRNCLDAKDSLSRKTKDLEKAILDLEKSLTTQ